MPEKKTQTNKKCRYLVGIEMILCHTHKVIYILYFRGPIGGFWASRLGEKLMENRIFLGKIDGIRDI